MLQEIGLRVHQWLYVASRGWIGHRLIGVPSLLLRTRGRRTGRERTNALIYARDDAAFIVVASNHGHDTNPAWYLNALAQPRVQVQVGRRRMPADSRAVEKGDPDYDRLWDLANRGNHDRYDGYQSSTSRPIPLLVLTPAA